METGIELVVRVLVGGAAIRPSVGRCPCRKSHPRSSCGMLVLMKHSTESVVSSYAKAGDLIRNHQWHGQWLERAGVRDAPMRPVPVVEKLELPQGMQKVGLVPDQCAVQ
jgi:hypothetical protein